VPLQLVVLLSKRRIPVPLRQDVVGLITVEVLDLIAQP